MPEGDVMILEGAAAGLVMWACDRLVGRAPSAARPEPARAAPRPAAPGPPRFTPRQAASFTHERGGRRRFDADVASRLRGMLSRLSASPVPGADLGGRGSVWSVGPAVPHAETAAGVVDRLLARGCTALGSLSLVVLPSDPRCPAVLLFVSDPRDADRLADPGGGYVAVLAEPPAAPAGIVEAPSAPAAPRPPPDAPAADARPRTPRTRGGRRPATPSPPPTPPTPDRPAIAAAGGPANGGPANGAAKITEETPDAPHPHAARA